MSRKKTNRVATHLSTAGRIAIAALSSAAATAAVLNFYFVPKKLPILDGLRVDACEQRPDEPTPDQITDFADGLGKLNRQYVFLKEFSIYGTGECRYIGRAPPASPVQARAIVKTKVSNDSSSIEVEFENISGYNGITVKITTPKDYPFSTTVCGESCVGAHGVYQIRADFVEGWGTLEFAPAPVVDKVANAYECTLKAMAAENWAERFFACY